MPEKSLDAPFSLCQHPKFCIISTQTHQLQLKKKQNSGKDQKNHMPAYSQRVFAQILLSLLCNCRSISKEKAI